MRRSSLATSFGPTLFAVALAGCSPSAAPDDREQALADARADADAATEVAFAGGELPACSLLGQAEVELVLGPLSVAPYARGDGGPEPGGSACGYRTADGRELVIAGSTGDASARLQEIDGGPVPVDGTWDEAGLVGCCTLQAVRGDALVMVDASAAKLDLVRVAALMSRALDGLEKPLTVDADAGAVAALALLGANTATPEAITPPSGP